MYYSSEEEVVTRLQDKEVLQLKNNFLAETNLLAINTMKEIGQKKKRGKGV